MSDKDRMNYSHLHVEQEHVIIKSFVIRQEDQSL